MTQILVADERARLLGALRSRCVDLVAQWGAVAGPSEEVIPDSQKCDVCGAAGIGGYLRPAWWSHPPWWLLRESDESSELVCSVACARAIDAPKPART